MEKENTGSKWIKNSAKLHADDITFEDMDDFDGMEDTVEKT